MRKLKKISMVLLLLAVPGPAAAQEGPLSVPESEMVYVYLKPEARTAASQLTLGDVAEVSGFNEELIGRLKELPLGPAPLPGDSLALARSDIRRIMIAHRIDPVNVALVGENRVEINRSGRVISKDDLTPLIEDYVRRCWSEKNVRTEIMYSRLPEDLAVDSENFVIKVLDPVKSMLSGSVAISLAALQDDRILARLPVSLKIRVWQEVAVLQRDLHQGEILTLDDFSFEEREITGRSGTPVTKAEQAVDKRLERSVKAGQVLGLENLENPPLIERGAEVTLIVRYKSITVGCLGKAFQKGRLGDRIMVRNQYGKNLIGEVRDEHTVVITP